MEINATLIFEIISFLILVGILAKYAYKPFLNFLDERAGQIEKNIIEARKNREEAEKHFSQAEETLKEAKRTALALKEQTVRNSEEAKEKILKEAQSQAGLIIEQSRKDILTEIEHAKSNLQAFVAKASVSIASKILNREIKEEDHEKIVEENIKRFKNE